jgi:glutamate N-acetyltransferase / amino-acid N-acetyltransferase
MCKGFKAAGMAAGIKKNGNKDLGLIVSDTPAAVAAVFTKNKVQAAPVLLDKERCKSGKCQAIIVNSGNANCCTGPQGMANAIAMSRLAANGLSISEELVCVASTGVIGQALPVEKIESAIPELIRSLSEEGFSDFAQAIMTTDTKPKIVSRSAEVSGKVFVVTGIAKGAGMICPDMATMLCFVCTDIAADTASLQPMLQKSVDQSFNRITIDGDTSTNDMVFVLANGMSGVLMNQEGAMGKFQTCLDEVLMELAKMVVKDGEGATKLVEVIVNGAASNADAKKIAYTIANSNLFKTALFGEDANWGRILAAAGRSGAALSPEKVDIFFNDVQMVKNGLWCGAEAEQKATRVLKTPEFNVTVDLKLGEGRSAYWTCDFSIDYVKINADYRS